MSENTEEAAPDVEAAEEHVDFEMPPFPGSPRDAFGPDFGSGRWLTDTSPLEPWRERLGLPLDEGYGRADRDAALELQRRFDLEETGTVDPLTWGAAWS